jgi:hypothetical protein
MSTKCGLIAALFFTALIVSLNVNPTPVYAGTNFIGDGASCIAIRGNGITNTCSYAVSILWCADTNQQDTCAKGLNNSWDFITGSPWVVPIHANSNGLSVSNVEGIACKRLPGRNAFDLGPGNNMNLKKWSAKCVSDNRLYSLPSGPAYISAPVVEYKH